MGPRVAINKKFTHDVVELVGVLSVPVGPAEVRAQSGSGPRDAKLHFGVRATTESGVFTKSSLASCVPSI